MLLDKFHCPLCRGPLRPAGDDDLACQACNAPVSVRDGVLDFVGGRFDTILDVESYDESHRIDPGRVDQNYRDMKRFAGDLWPPTLGSVLEVGCGTGLFSRALIAHGDATDVVLTDVSVAMLVNCRDQLSLLGLLPRLPITFATYSSKENCFRDAVFDTCAGTSVLHHIPDVRAFLAEVFRCLKPGGRAFFMEPNRRFNKALMHTLGDVMAQLLARGQPFSEDRQKLVNILAEGRRSILHQDDLEFLATIEDKHMFVAEEFEQMGLELGYASAAALPSGLHATGSAIIVSLCAQLGISDEVRREVVELLPAYSSRYLGLLSQRDLSSGFLLWLEKGVGPRTRGFRAPARGDDAQYSAVDPPDLGGGLPPRWSLGLEASVTDAGVALRLSGWCLVNADIRWLRVTLNDESRDTPVWRPRLDVQQALNAAGLYSAWNALCCGLEAEMVFAGVVPDPAGVQVRVEIVLCHGGTIAVPVPDIIRYDEAVRLTR